jgi:RNA polymerase sporulation-specific sigma factor
VAEIAEDMAVEPEELSLVMEANAEVESLQQVVYRGEGNEVTLMDRLEDGQDGEGRIRNRMLLQQLLSGLEGEERELLYLRYDQEKTQSAIARQLGISQVQVSRMEKKILKKIRTQQKLAAGE